MFFFCFSFPQYCDVHVPKIQEMLDKIPTPLSGAICNEKTGWLPPNFDDNCREILTETINELLESQPADFDPNALASTSKASAAQTVQQEQEQEWEYMVNWIELNRLQMESFDCKWTFFLRFSLALITGGRRRLRWRWTRAWSRAIVHWCRLWRRWYGLSHF